MGKIRINELARELEVKPARLIELLPEFGVTEKKTHSSSIDDEIANKLRRHFGVLPPEEAKQPVAEPKEEAKKEEVKPEPAAEPAAGAAPAASVVPPTVVEQMPPAAPAAAPSQAAHPQEQPLQAKPKEAEIFPAIRTVPQKLRPPLAGARVAEAPTQPPTPATSEAPAAAPPPPPPVERAPVTPPLKQQPTPTLKPGQIISPPRAVVPPVILQPPKEIKTPEALRTAEASRPATPPAAVTTPGQPGTAAPKPTLAGQPVSRPVVPPRPDVLARLTQPRPMPGQPQPRTQRPATTPMPGQPIYRGPIREGQTIRPAAPGARVVRGKVQGAGAAARLAEPIAPPAEPVRRVAEKKPAAKVVERDKEFEREEKDLRPAPKREPEQVEAVNKQITVSEGITVKELAEKLGLKASLVIKRLLERKIFATINQTLDVNLAVEIAKSFGAEATTSTFEEEAVQQIVQEAESEENLEKRPPVVTVMGHVDHGKTSLLDAIRHTNVAEKEAGGITQHIGAYCVEHDGRIITFIDTPGHEAFTRMRARGAKVTDLVVLVVAADDGVMPQTLEAIDHAKAAGVPILVAINKIDKPEAQPERVKQQLADRGLVPEEWGGDTVMVPVSAKTKQNLDLLLEMILLVSDLQELKANPNRPAMGTVLEAKVDRGRGPVATILVQNGTLSVGDYFICGTVLGKVRAMYDHAGRQVKKAGPSIPVEVLGFESLPEVGDTFQVVTDTAKAKQIVLYREAKAKEAALARTRLSLEHLHDQIKSGEVKELPIVLKTDVSGTAEVLSETLQKLSTEKVKVRILHASVGAISETDVLLASASNAIIVGFNVRPDRNAAQLAEQEKVDIRLHTVIYELVDEIKKAMAGLLEPVYKEVYKGRAEVRQIFHISKVGNVAGCVVLDGVLSRDSSVRVLRDNVVVYTGKVASLRRFKNDVSEVKSGTECGVALENFGDFKPGDIIEAFVMERVAAEALV